MNISCVPISNNMYLSEEGFGEFDYDIVCDLLRHVDIWLSEALEQEPFTSRQVVIVHNDDYPMCSNLGNYHIIHNSSSGDKWCRWVHEFAHEYCHHLIDGELTGEIDGLMWFEETICTVSTMYCMYRMRQYCQVSENPNLENTARLVQAHLEYLLQGGVAVAPLHLYIHRNLPLLEQPEYHREIYRNIARQILPLFAECPALWKIILHFGNMHERQSLTLLFDHLKEEADTTYADALQRLRVLLLGS